MSLVLEGEPDLGSPRRWPTAILAALLAMSAGVPPACAWTTGGHRLASARAVESMPSTVPLFFLRGGEAIAAASVDPDLMKHRDMPQLRDRESPDHYLDLELLAGRELPETRWAFVKLVTWLGAEPGGGRLWGPAEIGLLPYAVVEGVQRLTLGFAEHRARPADPHVQAKVLVYAGHLAHYAEDLCQPLHTTIHHDGRAGENGISSGTGLHRLTDSLFSHLEAAAPQRAAGLTAFADPFAAVKRQLARSHALVDRVYELEPLMRAAEEAGTDDARLESFARERFAETVRFTGSLFLTAWERSAAVELPPWLARPETRSSSPSQLPR